jgi:hypothetical protein
MDGATDVSGLKALALIPRSFVLSSQITQFHPSTHLPLQRDSWLAQISTPWITRKAAAPARLEEEEEAKLRMVSCGTGELLTPFLSVVIGSQIVERFFRLTLYSMSDRHPK